MDSPAPGPTTAATRRTLSWLGPITLLVAFTMVPAFIDVLVLNGVGEPVSPTRRRSPTRSW